MSLFIGIDWADESHDVYITSEKGESLSSFSIENSLLGFDTFINQISTYRVEASKVHVAIETPHGLLVEALINQQYKIYPINPKAVKNSREAYRVSGAKDDKFDAFVLANLLRTHFSSFRPLNPQSELTQEIRMLSEDRQTFVEHKTRILQQLRETLKVYYPQALSLFSRLDASISFAFLSKFCTPKEARNLKKSQLAAFLNEQGYTHPNRLDTIYQSLQLPQLQASEVVVRAKARRMLALVAQLKAISERIKEYDKALETLLKRHADTALFKSLPPVSNTLVAALIGQFSEQEAVFLTSKAIQCYGGTAPVTIQSGKKKLVVFRQSCNKFLRLCLQQMAFCSLKTVKWAREFYDKQKAKGKSHSLALRNLANQWVEILLVIWQKREKYDEAIYLSQRERCLKNAA